MKLLISAIATGLISTLVLLGLLAWASGESASTISPQPVSADGPELPNPLRGLYRWRGQEQVPVPASESYDRYVWRELEPSPDVYDFAVIDRDLAAAAQDGRKHAFRVRALVSTEGMALPNYLVKRMPKGWWYDYNQNEEADTYVPDWNDPDFMERADRLIAALGARYDHDPRLAWVEIGMYGNWGEWHMFSFPYPAPSGAQPMSAENRRRIVDMYRAAFPQTRLVMLSDDAESLAYALRASPDIGWRRDSLGDPHFDDLRQDAELWSLMRDRWKTAPVVTEFISPSRQRAPESYLLAAEQVRRYHISLVGNGNMLAWGGLDADSRAALLQLADASGYRLAPTRLTLPALLWPQGDLTVTSHWENAGVAPTYEPWQIVYQLREQGGGRVVWEGESALDLRQLLPTTPGAPQAHTDRLALGTGIARGVYDLALIVRDPAGRRAPMRLAIAGRGQDGSYLLGPISMMP